MSSDKFKRLNEEDENENDIELNNLNSNNNNSSNNNNNNDDSNNNNNNDSNKSTFSFNPINQIQNVFSNIDLNPLNVDFQVHRDRFVNFFQHGSDDINNRMQTVVSKIRSNEYRKKMHTVLTKIKDTKEYQSTSNTDYDVIFESVDMYSNLQADPTLDKDEIDVVTDITSYKKKFTHWLAKERISTLLFIPILGILVAIMGLFCDFLLMELSALRTFITSQHQNGQNVRYDFIEGLIFVGYSVAFAFFSVCCISFISPYAVGSGIPEMKSIMSGINLSRVLGLKTLVSKIGGMVCATAAGLTIGRTGPFMHASAIIAQEMMNLRFFANIKKNQIVRYQMLICALTSGVVANFGAPIGGLLFAIEVTATTAVMGNLWKGFFCGTTTAVIFYFTRFLFKGESFQSVYSFNFISKTYGILDLITFVIIGVITGLIGAFFVFVYEKLVRFRLRYPILKQSRIGLVVVIALLSATITYLAGPFCRIPLSKAMKELLKEGDPADGTFTAADSPNYKYYNLLVFICCKLLLTAFNIILPIPGGAITPFIVTGAGLGRLFGEVLKDFFDSEAISPQGYAAIASAGLVSGTIRNISPSIFVLELTGQISLLVPILICSITSTATGNMLNRPLFDTALKIQGLPFLSNYRSSKVYIMTAKQVMRKNINFLSMRSTVREIRAFLENFRYTFIPVVDSKENMLLVGIVERSSIMYMVDNHIEIMESKLTEFREKLKSNIKQTNNNTSISVLMDLAPSQVPDLTPLNKVFHLFTMLGLGFTFVTSMGRLVGVITKTDLMNQDL
ncbi:hypothetical protein DICPUDRAFT_53930 [Dictyostelium purpureum]|uniref:Chloride channel protein n=1 Tax=Dictyostelium purpureum TaxID=5786 RepID=F0ZEV4_DICPU|nr:uncharacterized protein DICPUDRAFT_53930 [Dictyostelium purpureum]EGC37557.1 hypothetical protein DICPUDRAFT_53930 [Dictyostelium purpureum]|eukprot:XP_003285948.1 hypothetical protein DICPUDRAFT_53930 [Dictyostelium purpureum]